MDRYLEEYGRNSSPRRIEGFVKSLATRISQPYNARKARVLAQSGEPIRLHLGCGSTYLDGWVNVDLLRPGRKVDLSWDLRRPLPFDSNSVDAVFSEHLFEHIPYNGALSLMKQSHRLLQSGGVFRCAVPDAGRYLHSYGNADDLIEAYRPGRPTKMMAVSEIFFFHEHASAYDFETFQALLAAAGFGEITQSSPGEGLLGSADSPSRALESLYVEAKKV